MRTNLHTERMWPNIQHCGNTTTGNINSQEISFSSLHRPIPELDQDRIWTEYLPIMVHSKCTIIGITSGGQQPPICFFWAIWFLFWLVFSYFIGFWCRALDLAGSSVSCRSHVNIPYPILSYDDGSWTVVNQRQQVFIKDMRLISRDTLLQKLQSCWSSALSLLPFGGDSASRTAPSRAL